MSKRLYVVLPEGGFCYWVFDEEKMTLTSKGETLNIDQFNDRGYSIVAGDHEYKQKLEGMGLSVSSEATETKVTTVGIRKECLKQLRTNLHNMQVLYPRLHAIDSVSSLTNTFLNTYNADCKSFADLLNRTHDMGIRDEVILSEAIREKLEKLKKKA